jgi:hypothetical protein
MRPQLTNLREYISVTILSKTARGVREDRRKSLAGSARLHAAGLSRCEAVVLRSCVTQLKPQSSFVN